MRVLNLLWALPVAAAIQFFCFFLARLAWCGLRDCHGPGSINNVHDLGSSIGALFLGGLLAAAVLMLAPWTKRARVRLIAPAVYAAVVAAMSFTAIVNPAFGLN